MKRRPQEIKIVKLFFLEISWGKGFLYIQPTSTRDLKVTLQVILSASLIWHFLQSEKHVWASILNGNEPILFLVAKFIVVGVTLLVIAKLR